MISKDYHKYVADLDALNASIVAAGLPRYPDANARFYGCGCVAWPDDPITTVYAVDDCTLEEWDIIDVCVEGAS